MIRPFRLRDVGLVARLQQEGVLLDLETSLTYPRSPLRTAILSSLPLSRTGTSTYVVNHKEEGNRSIGLAQMRQRLGRPEHVVVFIAPALTQGNGAHAIWQRLLAYLCVRTGEQNGQRLYAGLPADGEEYQIFRHVGFTAYAQEDVYELINPPTGLKGVEPLPMRRQRLHDSWGLQQLYATVTPRAVQNAEGSAQSHWELARPVWWRFPSMPACTHRPNVHDRVNHQPKDQRRFGCAFFEEPGAVDPHAGICEGGHRATGVPTSICKKIALIGALDPLLYLYGFRVRRGEVADQR